MVQTLALLTRNPDINVARSMDEGLGVLRGRQQLETGDLQNRQSALELGETEAKVGALQAFRAAGGMRNPSASKELAGFPDIYKSVVEAHQSLSNDPQRQKKLEDTALSLGSAAYRIAGMPEGQERTAAWNEALEMFRQDGTITEDQYRKAYGNPSALVLEQAIGQAVALGMGEKIKSVGGRTGAPGPDTDTINAIEKGVIDFRKAITPNTQYGALTPEQEAAIDSRVAEERARLEGVYGTNRSGAPARSPVLSLAPRGSGASPPDIFSREPIAGGGGDSSVPATHREAVRVTSREELEALPPGTPVILPDGRTTYRK